VLSPADGLVVAADGVVDLRRLVEGDDLDAHAHRFELLLEQLGLVDRGLLLRGGIAERERLSGLGLVLVDELLGLVGVVGRKAGVIEVPDVAGTEGPSRLGEDARTDDGVEVLEVERIRHRLTGLEVVERWLRGIEHHVGHL
jgi:hypothetical protein